MTRIAPSIVAFFAAAGAQVVIADIANPLRPADLLAKALLVTQLPPAYSFHFQTTEKFVHDSGKNGGRLGSSAHGNVKCDGSRFDISEVDSYVDDSGEKPFLATRGIWDGKWFVQRQQGVGERSGPLTVFASTQPSIGDGGIYRATTFGGFVDGIIRLDLRPMQQILLDSGAARIIGEQNCEGHLCAVVEGHTAFGTYKLWINAESDQRLIRAEAQKSPGDLNGWGSRLTTKFGEADWEFVIHDLAVQRIGAFLIPVSGVMEEAEHYTDGKFDVRRISVNRSRIEIAPDFSADKAFTMDGIPDGTTIIIAARAPDDHFSYIWKNGQIVRDDDQTTSKKIDSILESEKQSAQR